MLNAPQIDPVIFEIGPFAVRWYGMMYLLGFVGGYFLCRRLLPKRGLEMDSDRLADLILYALGGVILGGRLGYCLFYNAGYFLENPLKVFAVWEGGMSFHGGLLGVIVAATLFCRRFSYSPLAVGDVMVTATTLGLGLGRIGNFINGELWGRVTSVPWGMVFPNAGDLPRHPSQLYEAVLEGPVLMIILWMLCRPGIPKGVPFFSFFIGYGAFRFLVEFVREPDAHLGLLWAGATMGQLLSAPMILGGLLGLWWIKRRQGDNDV